MAGFIFFEKSPRNVAPELAAELAELARGLPHPLRTVAVTVDAEDAMLDAIVAAMKPDFLQLHGREKPQRIVELKQRHGLPAIKAFAVREAADLAALVPYEGIADRFLLDAKAPAVPTCRAAMAYPSTGDYCRRSIPKPPGCFQVALMWKI